MTGMMHELGLIASGGREGTIGRFKEQITRFARCNFTLIGPGPKGGQRYINAPPIKKMDVWFPSDPEQKTLWPSEITLSDDYYDSLKYHAIPFDFRRVKVIQNNAKAQDVYLWMTQRLCRLDKPLLMKWESLAADVWGSCHNENLQAELSKRTSCSTISLSRRADRGTPRGLFVQRVPTPYSETANCEKVTGKRKLSTNVLTTIGTNVLTQNHECFDDDTIYTCKPVIRLPVIGSPILWISFRFPLT